MTDLYRNNCDFFQFLFMTTVFGLGSNYTSIYEIFSDEYIKALGTEKDTKYK